MEIEQRPPNRPNFLLVVLLFGAAILVVFVLAYVVLHFGNKHVVPDGNNPHPNAALVLPSRTRAA